jgi:hypothetical protein
MTKDDVIRMAREAGMHRSTHNLASNPVQHRYSYDGYEENLERFATLVAAAEREACAKVAEQTVCDTHLPTGVKIYGTRVAKAIRSRT